MYCSPQLYLTPSTTKIDGYQLLKTPFQKNVYFFSIIIYFLKTDNKISFRNILVSYLLIFIIGIAWEYYEFRLDMMHGKIWAGLFESLKDMLNNSLGFVAAVLNLKFKNSKN
jgi:hypothetical protein